MKESIVINLLDQYQQAAMHIAEAQVQVRELNKIIDEQIELLGNLKHDILALLAGHEEEPDPNSVPEVLPPVTDLENVVDKTPGWALAKRMGKQVILKNPDTGEEKEFPTKTAACKFLGISAISLQRDIDRDGMHGEWRISIADSPTA